MGRTLLKTTYTETVDLYGTQQTRTLFYCYNRTVDIVSIFDDTGKLLFDYEDIGKNKFIDALIKLIEGDENTPGVEFMSEEDKKICFPYEYK
jgi:hypothetical protein